MTSRAPLVLAALLALALGCDKKTPPPAPAASASASAAPEPPPGPKTYAGTYTSKHATFYVPDGSAWSGVKFRGDDAGDALGAGKLHFTVGPDAGTLSGEGEGPLGPVLLRGIVRGPDVTFSVIRKDPEDKGVTGTGVGTLDDAGTVQGTMHLSAYQAQIIREATFEAKATKP